MLSARVKNKADGSGDSQQALVRLHELTESAKALVVFDFAPKKVGHVQYLGRFLRNHDPADQFAATRTGCFP
jgi:hypothetical protein